MSLIAVKSLDRVYMRDVAGIDQVNTLTATRILYIPPWEPQ